MKELSALEQATESIKNTVAGEIWAKIRNLKIDVFSLPYQIVEFHAIPQAIDPTKLFLKLKSSAVLPSLEIALEDKFPGQYTVEQQKQFTVISKV
jgi:hypothetical protein